jgi:ABC-type transport system involved in multi-copper enzyme maturation permease subunit
MSTKAITALFWKEYRQQIMLLITIFMLGVLFQLAACLSTFSTPMQPYFWTLGMFVTVLYAAGAAGILFSREHDEKTFGFLRSLPITADTILVGKLS